MNDPRRGVHSRETGPAGTNTTDSASPDRDYSGRKTACHSRSVARATETALAGEVTDFSVLVRSQQQHVSNCF